MGQREGKEGVLLCVCHCSLAFFSPLENVAHFPVGYNSSN